jgi:hypothetical protein
VRREPGTIASAITAGMIGQTRNEQMASTSAAIAVPSVRGATGPA